VSVSQYRFSRKTVTVGLDPLPHRCWYMLAKWLRHPQTTINKRWSVLCGVPAGYGWYKVGGGSRRAREAGSNRCWLFETLLRLASDGLWLFQWDTFDMCRHRLTTVNRTSN
jgi:hypothetical protein